MNRHRRFPLSMLAVLAILLAACGSAGGSAPPTSVPSAPPTATPSTVPTASATVVPAASPTPGPSASAAVQACTVEPQDGRLPSDRFTDIGVETSPGRDIVRFTFGTGALTPAGPPVGALTVAVPPFTAAGSGLPIDLAGDHAIQLVFRGMSIMNDVGQPTFTGERDIRVTAPTSSLRQVVLFDESEGQVGWYVGYDGPGCVTLSREGNDVLLTFDYGPAG